MRGHILVVLLLLFSQNVLEPLGGQHILKVSELCLLRSLQEGSVTALVQPCFAVFIAFSN